MIVLYMRKEKTASLCVSGLTVFFARLEMWILLFTAFYTSQKALYLNGLPLTSFNIAAYLFTAFYRNKPQINPKKWLADSFVAVLFRMTEDVQKCVRRYAHPLNKVNKQLILPYTSHKPYNVYINIK